MSTPPTPKGYVEAPCPLMASGSLSFAPADSLTMTFMPEGTTRFSVSQPFWGAISRSIYTSERENVAHSVANASRSLAGYVYCFPVGGGTIYEKIGDARREFLFRTLRGSSFFDPLKVPKPGSIRNRAS